MKDKKWVVYEHVFPNGKRYIGITSKNPKARWERGQGYKSKGSAVYNAIQKYGWDNIEHNILFENFTQKQACQKEKELIAFYKTNIRRYGDKYGYNMTDGGEGTLGHVMPEETKAKNRNRLLGKTGKDCPNSRPVLCDGVEYASLTEFKEKNNYPKGNINGWLLGKVGMPKFWYDKGLCYKELGTEITHLSKIADKRRLHACADNIEFATLEECGKYLGTSASNISLYLNNKRVPPENIIEHNLRYANESKHSFKKKSNKKGNKV